MDHEILISIGDWCQFATIPLVLVAYIPQWVTIIKNRSSADVSLSAWMLWLVSSVLSLVYALAQVSVHGSGSDALLWSCLANLAFMFITIGLILRYSQRAEERISAVSVSLEHLSESRLSLNELALNASAAPTIEGSHGESARLT